MMPLPIRYDKNTILSFDKISKMGRYYWINSKQHKLFSVCLVCVEGGGGGNQLNQLRYNPQPSHCLLSGLASLRAVQELGYVAQCDGRLQTGLQASGRQVPLATDICIGLADHSFRIHKYIAVQARHACNRRACVWTDVHKADNPRNPAIRVLNGLLLSIFHPLRLASFCAVFFHLQAFQLTEKQVSAHQCSGSGEYTSVLDGWLEGRLGAGEVSAGSGWRWWCREISPYYSIHPGQ